MRHHLDIFSMDDGSEPRSMKNFDCNFNSFDSCDEEPNNH